MIRQSAAMLLSILIATAASAATTKTDRQTRMEERREFVTGFAGEAQSSVRFSRFYDFEPLGTDTLLLYESLNRAYLVKIEDFCPDMPSAFKLGVDNSSSSLHVRLDAIVVRGNRCRIIEIRPVDVKAMKAAQKAKREAAKAAAKPA
ncbi:MAG: DUF6491 family protein [Arenimonas sp.]